ncbi:hypothetical protein LO80_02715 [Candidatus Francisella endociliophora]|uniref:Uncharacterized protein n=1 Tax=Candidatus Francisella endociliophora TaxID=653937 RepID=A0A097EN56_9GAMM|nr:hypothetical protein [Francisella sp. FSC1006]AIT08996.1 hypothetical protein LO80_02715 [Francisella sp. FSC1006]
MRQQILLTWGILVSTLSLSYAKEDVFKGSDLISTDVGAVYTYTSPNTKYPEARKYDRFVKSCNENKTQCTYQLRNYDSEGKPSGYSEYTYVIKDGAVYQTNSMKVKDSDGKIRTMKLGDSELQEPPLFPKKIELNKVESSSNSYDGYTVNEKSKYTKLIPKIDINGNTYNSCVQFELENNVDYKDQPDRNTKYNSISIYCKGIGEVYTKYSMLNNKDEYLNGQKDIVSSLYSITSK